MNVSKCGPGNTNGYSSVPVRVYADPGDLYLAEPSDAEIDRVLSDFTFEWVDYGGDDEPWAPYDNWTFDQSSTDPSKIVAVAKIDLLRHQKFDTDLPFAAPGQRCTSTWSTTSRPSGCTWDVA